MQSLSGHVAELRLSASEEQVLIACPPEAVPATGQYLMAAERDAIQATPLYLAGIWKQGFAAGKPYPSAWGPGTELVIYGPLGNGFHLPADVQRLALIGLGTTNARLMPLVNELKSPQASITLFSDAQSPRLPPDVEAYPVQDLPEAFGWADFFAVDIPMAGLERLAGLFTQPDSTPPGLHGQVLVKADMPCCGLGKCGVCALRVNRTWRFTCEDGPVFDLAEVVKGLRW